MTQPIIPTNVAAAFESIRQACSVGQASILDSKHTLTTSLGSDWTAYDVSSILLPMLEAVEASILSIGEVLNGWIATYPLLQEAKRG